LELVGDKREALRAWRDTRRLELLRGYVGADAEYSRARVLALAKEVVP
jgi:hypothetical protein